MEKRIVEKKKKKNSWDSVLPRSGLNPGFLPDKGQAGVDSFNAMQGSGDVGEACFEDLDLLDEASGFPRTANQAISSVFSSNSRDVMAKRSGAIINSDISKILNLSIVDYLPDSELNPQTDDLVDTSNNWGSRDKEAQITQKVKHRILGVHPRNKSDETVLTLLSEYLPLRDNTELYNTAFNEIKNKALEDNNIKEIYDKYYAGLYSQDGLAEALRANTSALKRRDILGRVKELKAWFIRACWEVDSIFDLSDNYSTVLTKALGDYCVRHNDFVVDNYGSNLILIDNKPFRLVINDISNIQLRRLNLIGNKLVGYPKSMAIDFVCALSEDGSESYANFDEFSAAYPKLLLNESLKEAKEEFKKISFNDLRKYLENNLSKEYISDEIIAQIIERYLTPELNKELFGDRYLSSADKGKVIWSSPRASKLKQLILAQYVRYLLSQSDYRDIEILSKANPSFDEFDLKYKLKPEDVIIRYVDKDDDYEIDLKRDQPINIEDIYKAVKDKKIINLSVRDPHFLDASGNIVPGVKFVYGPKGSYDKTSCIINILTTSSCDVGSIYKVLVDRQIKDSKLSLGKMLKNNKIDNVDTIEIIGNILNPETFTSLKCNKVSFNHFTAKYFDRGCFKYLDCPTIEIPPSVVTLSESCFAYSEMTSIFIPATVLNIGDKCFEGCYKLTVNFEVDKSELDKSRSKYSTAKYSGYNTKWGKTDVAKITYNNAVTLESLTEEDDDDFVTDDFGSKIAENNTYRVYKLETKEHCNKLIEYLKNAGLDDNKLINLTSGIISDVGSWGYVRYFIENKKDLADSKIYKAENSVIRSLVDKDGNYRDLYLKDALVNDEDLRDVTLFNNYFDKTADLREILKSIGITKETPFDDKKYYIDSYIESPSVYNQTENLLKVFLKYIDNGDYSAAFELADIPYPEFDAFKDVVKKALSSAKGKKILQDNNIDETDAINAVDGFGELHDIIKYSAMKTLLDTIVYNVKEFISKRSSIDSFYNSGAHVDVDFNKNKARLHLLDLYRYKPEINKNNLFDIAYDYIEDRITKSMSNTKVYARGSSYSDSSINNNQEPYSLNQKSFLNNLEDNIKYYYN